jgi:hypothetical protein
METAGEDSREQAAAEDKRNSLNLYKLLCPWFCHPGPGRPAGGGKLIHLFGGLTRRIPDLPRRQAGALHLRESA